MIGFWWSFRSRIFFAFCIFYLLYSEHGVPQAIAQELPKRRVRTITYDQKLPSLRPTTLAGRLLLALHVSPGDSIIDSELLFSEGTFLNNRSRTDNSPRNSVEARRTVRSLLATGFFERAEFRTDVVVDSLFADAILLQQTDVTLFLQDRIHAAPYAIVHTGGGTARAGWGMDVVNLLETRMNLDAQAQWKSENTIGWEGAMTLTSSRLWFADELAATLHLKANRVRSEQELMLWRPFERDGYWFYGLRCHNASGSEFVYGSANSVGNDGAAFTLSPFYERGVEAYISAASSYHDQDWIWNILMLGIRDSKRSARSLWRMLDESIYAMSSGSVEFQTDAENERSPAIGGTAWADMSQAMQNNYLPGLGLTVAAGIVQQFDPLLVNEKISSFYGSMAFDYAAFIKRGGYIFGQVALAWIDRDATAPNHGGIFLDAKAKMHLYSASSLMFAANLMVQSAYPRLGFRQAVVDNEGGVRGYPANVLVGNGKAVINAELRGIPLGEAGQYRLSGVLFMDAAMVFNAVQNRIVDGFPAYSPRGEWFPSFGAGLRLQYPALTGGTSVFRIDVAYLPFMERFGQIILSTQEAFSLFGERRTAAMPHVIGDE